MEASQFELAYNVACARIGGGQFSQAKEKLQIALSVCRESLSGEEFTEEEVEVELGVLTAQVYISLYINI